MAHLFEVVKASCPKSSVVKRPSPARVGAVPMTVARILKSRMTVTCHVRFGSSGGVSDGPADCNLAGALAQDAAITPRLSLTANLGSLKPPFTFSYAINSNILYL